MTDDSMIYRKTGSINYADRQDTYRNEEGFLIHKCWDAENTRMCICRDVVVVPLEDERYLIGTQPKAEQNTGEKGGE